MNLSTLSDILDRDADTHETMARFGHLQSLPDLHYHDVVQIDPDTLRILRDRLQWIQDIRHPSKPCSITRAVIVWLDVILAVRAQVDHAAV